MCIVLFFVLLRIKQKQSKTQDSGSSLVNSPRTQNTTLGQSRVMITISSCQTNVFKHKLFILLSFSRLICPHFVNTSFSSLVLVFMLHYRFHFINHIRESWLKDRLSLNNKPQSRLPLALSLIKHWKGELS